MNYSFVIDFCFRIIIKSLDHVDMKCLKSSLCFNFKATNDDFGCTRGMFVVVVFSAFKPVFSNCIVQYLLGKYIKQTEREKLVKRYVSFDFMSSLNRVWKKYEKLLRYQNPVDFLKFWVHKSLSLLILIKAKENTRLSSHDILQNAYDFSVKNVPV